MSMLSSIAKGTPQSGCGEGRKCAGFRQDLDLRAQCDEKCDPPLPQGG